MDKTICGHERGILRRALQGWQLAPATTQYIIDGGGEFSDAERDARRDANDPAKLAEMLAARGRELGLSIAIYDNHRRFRMSGAPVVYALLIVANGFSIMDRDRWGWDFDMPQTRTILLQWLQLPDGAREQAERVLRGER